MFCDFEVDIVSCRQSQNLTREGVLITVKPLGSGNKSVVFLQLLKTIVGAALLGNCNHVAGLNKIGRDVDALAIDREVAVVDQLTGLTAGVGKAQTVNNIVQTALQQRPQHIYRKF